MRKRRAPRQGPLTRIAAQSDLSSQGRGDLRYGIAFRQFAPRGPWLEAASSYLSPKGRGDLRRGIAFRHFAPRGRWLEAASSYLSLWGRGRRKASGEGASAANGALHP